jgi:hypothetical protein
MRTSLSEIAVDQNLRGGRFVVALVERLEESSDGEECDIIS